MAIVRTWENAAIITPECPFDMYRSSRGSTDLDGVPQCILCVTPYEGCNTVDKARTYSVYLGVASNWTFNNVDPADETFLRTALVTTDLSWQDIVGCHWTGSQSQGGGADEINIDFDLTITDGTEPERVNLSLEIDLEAEIGGAGPGTHTFVTYTVDNIHPSDLSDVVLNTAATLAARTHEFDAGPPAVEMIFPTSYVLRIGEFEA